MTRTTENYGMRLSYFHEYAISKGVSSLDPKRDIHIQGLRSKLMKPDADRDTDLAGRIVRDFREWSGGFRPESPDQIHSYIASSLPADLGVDEAQAFQFLTDWMETEDDD